LAISLSSETTASATTSTTVDASHTLATGSNRKLVAVVLQENNYGYQRDLVDVVFDPGGTDEATFTAVIASTGTSSFLAAGIYYLDEADIPTSGTYTIRYTGTDSSDVTSITVFEFHDAAQGAVADSDELDNSASTTPTLTLTTTSGDICVDGFCGLDPRTFTVGSGQTETLNDTTNGNAGISYKTASSTSTSLSWTIGGGTHAREIHLAAAISSAAGGGTDLAFLEQVI